MSAIAETDCKLFRVCFLKLDGNSLQMFARFRVPHAQPLRNYLVVQLLTKTFCAIIHPAAFFVVTQKLLTYFSSSD